MSDHKGIPPKTDVTLLLLSGVAVAIVVAAVLSKDNAGIIVGFGGIVCGQLYASWKASQENREVKDTLLQSSGKQIEEVREVKETLATSTEKIEQAATLNADQQNRMEKTGEDTHYLVNGTMGANLFIIAELREEKAARTGKGADKEAAAEARKKYDEHMEQLKKLEALREAIRPKELAPQEVTIVGQSDPVVVTTEGKKA